MTTAATSLLGLALPVQGELQGTWGDTVNNSITSLLDSAVAGTTNISTDADVTLTTTTLAANQAREAILLFSGARTALRNVTAPAQSKIYTVINATTGGYSVVLRGAGPTTGVTILAGESAVCAWNGSDFVKVSNSGASTFYTITATAPTTASANKGAINYGTLSFSDTGIVQSAQTSVNSYFQNVMQNTSNGTQASAEFIAYNDQGTASTNYATVGINSSGYSGTGSINAAGYGYFLSASTDLVLGTIGANGIHFTTNSSASDALAISSTGVISIPSSGTANGVAYLNASKQLTTGSALTYNGTNLTLTSGYFEITGANNLYLGSGKLSSSSGVLPLIFGLNDVEQMRLTSTGLGIGTSSPSAKLDIAGNLRIDGTGNIYGPTSNAGFISLFGGGVYNSGAGIGLGGSGNGTANTIVFTRGNYVESARIDSAGNLGLGVTPSAWDSSSSRRAFELGYSGSGLYTYAQSNTLFAANAYFNGSFKYAYTGFASSYYAQVSGEHRWNTAPSGTAGNAITFTQAMTLDASGQWMVGTTTPYGVSGGGTTMGTISYDQNGRTQAVVTNQNSGASASAALVLGAYGADWIIGAGSSANNSTSLTFTRATTEFARIDSSGNLLVGTTSNSINGSVGSGFSSSNTTGGSGVAFVYNSASSSSDNAPCLSLLKASTTTSSSARFIQFYANGQATPMGGIVGNGASNVQFATLSDAREKQNIQTITGSLAKINALRPVEFDWIADGSHVPAGFVAQEVEQVFPEFVVENMSNDGQEERKGLTGGMTGGIVAHLVKAIQEQQAIITAQQAALESLRKRLSALESK
jgi:hypothetical protein